MELEDDALNELRLGAITAIDGLWFLAAEKRLGFEAAFELDLEVWKAYGLVQLKRLARLLDIPLEPGAPPDLATVNFLVEALCRIDGTECAWELLDDDTSVFRVYRCPWWDNLRGSGRSEVVNCELVDNTIFADWLEKLDPAIEMEITRSLPRGHEHCEWTLRRRR